MRALTSENERLRLENERLNAEIARLREEATQREQLERLLEVKNASSNQEFVAASIFARDPSNLRQLVAIDRGTRRRAQGRHAGRHRGQDAGRHRDAASRTTTPG